VPGLSISLVNADNDSQLMTTLTAKNDRNFKVRKFFPVFSCSSTGSIRDDTYWTSRKNSLELVV
jgi:hypothetical protein